MTYPDLWLNLAYGLLKAVMYILVFSISLTLSFSWWFLGILIVYSVIGTLLTHYIARPLIHLNYEQQRLEASYRNNLTVDNFGSCIRIMLGLAKKQKHLTYFQQFYGQLGVIVPLLIIAPIYFTGGMTLGTLMRFNSLSATILDNMSYGITSFGQINRLRSCRKRLKEAGIL
jgi:putative ATP-binding cassette transporter